MSRPLWIITIVYWLSRILFYAFVFDDSYNIHMAISFDERARAVAESRSFYYFTAWGTFPVYLGSIYKILSFFDLLAHRFHILYWLQSGLVFGAVILAVKIMEKWRERENLPAWTPLVTGLVLSLDFQTLYYGSMAISEPFFVAAFTAALWLMSTARSTRFTDDLVLGALLAIAAVMRNIILPLIPAFLLLRGYQAYRGKEKWSSVSLTFIGFVTVYAFSGWGARLHERTDASEISLNRYVNFAQTWCEARMMGFDRPDGQFWFTPPPYRTAPISSSLVFDRPFTDAGFYLKTAAQCLVNAPAKLIGQFHSIRNVFWGALYPDPLAVNDQLWLRLFNRVFAIGLLVGLIAAGFRPAFFNSWAMRAFVCMLLSVYVASPGEERFKTSFIIPLTLLGVAGWSGLLAETKRRTLGFLGVIAISLAFNGWLPGWRARQIVEREEFLRRPAGEIQNLVEKRLGLITPHLSNEDPCERPIAEPGPDPNPMTWFCWHWTQATAPGVSTRNAAWPQQRPAAWRAQEPEDPYNFLYVAGDLIRITHFLARDPATQIYSERDVRLLLHKLLSYQLIRPEMKGHRLFGSVITDLRDLYARAEHQQAFAIALRYWLENNSSLRDNPE